MRFFKLFIVLSAFVSLVFFLRATDFDKVRALLLQTGWKFLLLIGATFMAYVSAALSWWYCMGGRRKGVSVPRLFLIRHVGETVSLVNPASIVAGETVKAWLLKGGPGGNHGIAASILLSRAAVIFTQLLLFFATVIPLLGSGRISVPFEGGGAVNAILILLSLFLFTAALLTYRKQIFFMAAFRRSILRTKRGIAVRRRIRFTRIKLRKLVSELRSLYRYSRTALLLALTFALLHWIFGALEFYFILRFLGVKATLTEAVLVDMGVIFFKSAGAFIPGQLGMEEYGNKVMLAVIGVQGTAVWVAASILRRTRQLVWIVVGLAAYFIISRRNRPVAQNVNGNIICKS